MDCLLLTLSVGLVINCVEFYMLGLMDQLEAPILLGVCFVAVALISIVLSVMAWISRLVPHPVGSVSLSKRSLWCSLYLISSCLVKLTLPRPPLCAAQAREPEQESAASDRAALAGPCCCVLLRAHDRRSRAGGDGRAAGQLQSWVPGAATGL